MTPGKTIDIWEDRICGRPAVMHGCVTLFTAWTKDERGWHHRGSFFSRVQAEKAAEA